MTQCSASTALANVAKASASEAAYDALAEVFGDATGDSVKICMIGAIVEIGYQNEGMDVYGEWS
ncbi:MAG: hypothetical protein A3J29_06680 [Acidobacteria bacterium RIFCSPLOWO2_12_FULL_67_14b]|nr:MAG: hypothetical protein A3J29_06680 [Acidobacteria bacterium RIFCSPLOWO2_12_FULL_67_14b]